MRKEWKSRPTPITIEQVTHLAREVLLRDGHHTPTLIVDGSRNPIVIQMEVLAPTFEERMQQMFVTGQALARRGTGKIQSLFFLSEAWLSETPEGKLPYQLPSKDPKRKEVLLVNGLQLVPHRVQLAVYEMLRDKQRTLLEIRPWEYPDNPDDAADTPLLEAFLAGFLGITGLR